MAISPIYVKYKLNRENLDTFLHQSQMYLIHILMDTDTWRW